jgi:hypothetical protein
MITRHLDRKDVPAHLRTGYNGARFQAQLTDAVTIPATAGLWDGGSRDVFSSIELATGHTVTACNADPFNGSAKDRRLAIPQGVAIIRHSTFQGRDMGLTYYVRPDDAAPLLGAPAPTLSDLERAVLTITRNCISSYRQDEARRQGIGPTSWEGAKNRLIEAGLMKPNGAITTAGKNAI